MQRNIIIGILVVVVVVFGGILLLDTQNSAVSSLKSSGVLSPENLSDVNQESPQNSLVKEYSNEVYKFSFEYPKNFLLTEQTMSEEKQNIYGDLGCAQTLVINIKDPNAQSVRYEAGAAPVQPSIQVAVRKATCYADKNSPPTIDKLETSKVIDGQKPIIKLHQDIYNSLLQLGFSEKMSGVIALAIPIHGDFTDPNRTNSEDVVWKNSCVVGLVKKNTQSVSYIKNTDCRLDSGLFEETVSFIPSVRGDFFIEVRANKSPYDSAEFSVIDSILSSFSFKN